MSCGPYKVVADGNIGVKDYNFVIEVRSARTPEGKKLTEPGDLIPGQIVSFGTTTAESQAFTVTGIPFYILDAWLLFRVKKDICPGCNTSNYKISTILLDHINAKGIVAKLSCKKPVQASSGQ